MSTVYKALDLRFANVERTCAVKEMFDPGGDEALRCQRTGNFEREAGLLAVLSHPLIPKIFDFFSENGNHYLVQEFIPGQNLETLLERLREPAGIPVDRLGYEHLRCAELSAWAVAESDHLS